MFVFHRGCFGSGSGLLSALPGAVCPLTFKTDVGVPHQGRAVLVDVRRSGRDDGEAVVGRRHARGLDRPPEDKVDEGRLPSGSRIRVSVRVDLP